MRPINEYAEAAHEHVTEHMRKWENDFFKKATSRTKTSLDKMNLQWTAHLHQEKTQ